MRLINNDPIIQLRNIHLFITLYSLLHLFIAAEKFVLLKIFVIGIIVLYKDISNKTKQD